MSELPAAHLFAGKLVRLAAFTADDRIVSARWTHDAEFLRLMQSNPAWPAYPEFFPLPERNDEWRVFTFGLRTLTEDRLIGFADLSVEWSNQVAWLAIGIGERDYWGRGYGSDALRLILAYAFRELNLYRVSLIVFSYNTRAIHVYEKAGFVHEGRQRAALYRDGERHDMLVMGMLRPEWLARYAT
jgi:RimJ/RimL family protein N-acetyltransferase